MVVANIVDEPEPWRTPKPVASSMERPRSVVRDGHAESTTIAPGDELSLRVNLSTLSSWPPKFGIEPATMTFVRLTPIKRVVR